MTAAAPKQVGLYMGHAAIMSFDGPYRFLSNFWPASMRIHGIVFRTVEHAFQAAKSEDPADWKHVASLSTPGQAKRAGRKIVLRPGWDEMRELVMGALLRKKFAHGTLLAHDLVNTHMFHLVEGNTWGDTFWGVDLREPAFPGENTLGELLMAHRRWLMSQPDPGVDIDHGWATGF